MLLIGDKNVCCKISMMCNNFSANELNVLGNIYTSTCTKRTTQRVAFDLIYAISLDSPELFIIHPPSLLSSSKALSWADKQTAAEVRKTVWKKLPGVLEHSSFQ